MAAEIPDTMTIFKDSKHLVLVEDSINDVLTVSLNYGAKVYRGVLLDSSNRNLPYGINVVKTDSNQAFSTKRDAIVQLEKNVLTKRNSQPTQHSALSYRNTYYQNVENKTANIVGSAVHSLLRPLRDKNIRNMRLRPRQVLCSKCKAACNENSVARPDSSKVPTIVTATKMNPIRSNTTKLSSNMLPKLSLPRVSVRDGQRKRKMLSDEQSEYNRKLRKLMTRKPPVTQNTTKSSSVIKILFANPQGQRSSTVVEIPTESASSPNINVHQTAVMPVPIDNVSVDKTEIKKARKALKKAKREKRRLEKGIADAGETHSSKHKHKKHKHRDTERPMTSSDMSPASLSASCNSSSSGNNSFNIDKTECVPSTSPPVQQPNVSSVPIGAFPGKWIPIGSSIALNNNESPESNKCTITDDTNEQNTADASSDKYVNGIIQYPVSPSSSSHSNMNSTHNVYDFVDDCDESNDDGIIQSTNDTQPLMMRIHTYNILECENSRGSMLHVGDVVWGKIQGFPWWPGRIISITVTQRENGMLVGRVAHLTWFASRTMSHIDCMELYPFLEDFKRRYNKQKRGPYKMAIKQATLAVEDVLTRESKAIMESNDITEDKLTTEEELEIAIT